MLMSSDKAKVLRFVTVIGGYLCDVNFRSMSRNLTIPSGLHFCTPTSYKGAASFYEILVSLATKSGLVHGPWSTHGLVDPPANAECRVGVYESLRERDCGIFDTKEKSKPNRWIGVCKCSSLDSDAILSTLVMTDGILNFPVHNDNKLESTHLLCCCIRVNGAPLSAKICP